MSRNDNKKHNKSEDNKSEDDQSVILFERALSKVEKNMNALALLMEHFERSGFDKTKYSQSFQDMMGKFAKLMKEYTRTEYEYEGPYNADQTQERYKASVAKSWKHKPDKAENCDVPITEAEIKAAHDEYMQKKEAMQAKRVQQALLEGTKERPMITGPDGKQRYDFVADAESSDEDDDTMIRRVIGGDPNPGKNDTNKLREAHMARLKSESAPVSRRLENKAAPVKTRDTNLINLLKTGGGDQFQDYALDELDDVHSMQKGFLAEVGSDEEDDPSSKFGRRASKARGNTAIKRTEQEMARRAAVQAARDQKAKSRSETGEH
jgi:hypothetical protein